MKADNTMDAVTGRYGTLAVSTCCLSCGGAAARAGISRGETCLDLGSGRGNDVIRMAAEAGPDGFAYGIDATPEMIDRARSTAEKLGVKNAAFLQGTLDRIPIASITVDCVVSNCTINHAPDKKAVWREIYRVLKPGGRFVISDIYSSETVPVEFANDPEAVAECWAGSQTRQEYLETVIGAGFSGVHVVEESDPYPKGKIEVSSFTIAGEKPAGCGCAGGCCG